MKRALIVIGLMTAFFGCADLGTIDEGVEGAKTHALNDSIEQSSVLDGLRALITEQVHLPLSLGM